MFARAVQHPHRWILYSFLGLAYAALLLEVLDFPPIWGVVDAHASWHAATVPLTYLFYAFIRGDADWVNALRQIRAMKGL